MDESALLGALSNGNVCGAGLDVFSEEPKVHPVLAEHPRVVVLPHVGSATTVTRRAMAQLAVENARPVLEGKPPITPVAP